MRGSTAAPTCARGPQTLVDDDLLFHCSPDLVPTTQRFGVSLDSPQTLLVTHAHFDHFLIDNLNLRRPDLRRDSPMARLHVYGPGPVTRQIRRGSRWPSLVAQGHVSIETVRAGHRSRGGQYQITALQANHDHGGATLLYIVSGGQHSLFHGTDSSPLSERSWQVVARDGPFDAVLMDETMGQSAHVGSHNNVQSSLQARQHFVDQRLLKKGALFVALHFSHDGDLSREELLHCLGPHGATVAYDGLNLSL